MWGGGMGHTKKGDCKTFPFYADFNLNNQITKTIFGLFTNI
jgi:hypothetical protein